jgi:hypothetical protein
MEGTRGRALNYTYRIDFKSSGGEGGLYLSIFRNSLRFCHFARNSNVFCRLLRSLSSRIRLSDAAQSLQWTSKVLKKSNMSNKPGFSFSRLVWAICQLPTSSRAGF